MAFSKISVEVQSITGKKHTLDMVVDTACYRSYFTWTAKTRLGLPTTGLTEEAVTVDGSLMMGTIHEVRLYLVDKGGREVVLNMEALFIEGLQTSLLGQDILSMWYNLSRETLSLTIYQSVYNFCLSDTPDYQQINSFRKMPGTVEVSKLGEKEKKGATTEEQRG